VRTVLVKLEQDAAPAVGVGGELAVRRSAVTVLDARVRPPSND
jgi:hypothetical protein